MKPLIVTALVFLTLGTSQQSFAQQSALNAGAAKVEITPAETELPRTYEGILDHLYARAIVLDSGATSAALISLDAGGVSRADLARSMPPAASTSATRCL